MAITGDEPVSACRVCGGDIYARGLCYADWRSVRRTGKVRSPEAIARHRTRAFEREQMLLRALEIRSAKM